MRMLADNPSIAFLRQEAKDLHAVLRGSDDRATLSDAQRRIAGDYGFRSWSELKAEVVRRRTEVPQPPDGLAEDAASAFGLGRVTDMVAVRYEYMGRRWDLRTDEGRFIVRPVFDWIDDEQAEIAVDLQERARAAGVRSPVPVRMRDGGLVARILDQSWRVEEWMDLGPRPVEPVPDAVAQAAGKVLAAIHGVAPATDRPIQGMWVSPDERPTDDAWRALLDRARAAEAWWAADLAALAPNIAELSRIGTSVPTEGIVITNRDMGMDQVRMGPGGELVIMHWDFAGPGSREWELAGTLFQWTGEGTNLESARSLMEGYRSRCGEQPSLSLESFSGVVTGALTWILHRGWEASAPEPSEQRDYAERTLREVLDDPLTVDRLDALLAAVE